MNSHRGFTLIEILVVLSVLAILGAFGFAALVNYSRTQTLKTAARDLTTHLRVAQNKAIVQEKPVGSTGCGSNALTGYRLQFTSDTDYSIVAVCSQTITVSQFKLSQTIKKTSPDGTLNLDFLVSTGKLSQADTTITLTSDFGQTENIVVKQSGVIQ